MLVLTRKPGEVIVLDGGIRITVLSSDRKGVRLGIDAPPAVSVLRGELVEAIAAENQRASVSGNTVDIPDSLRPRSMAVR
jgi:carbon storage regulator